VAILALLTPYLFFFLEHAGELRIIFNKEEGFDRSLTG